MRKTKIVCTLGPASETEEVIAAMADAGMNVARINFSHGTHEEHAAKIAMIKRSARRRTFPCPFCWTPRDRNFASRRSKTARSR